MRIAGVLGGLALAVAAGPAGAGTVVLQQSGSTATLDLFHVALPGAGTYQFDVSSSVPVTFQFEAGYTYHWDVFVAPPPRPHDEFIEGNTADVFETGTVTALSTSFTFTVPQTAFTFFPAPQFYELFGVAEGTPLYREDKYEDPFFSLFVADNSPASGAFDYGLTVTSVAPVPEPSVWAEMILGFVAAGLVVRSRRRVALRA